MPTPELLISVITVAFNEEATVEKTLRSIVGQDWGHRELIFIDGASTDATMAIAARFKSECAHFLSEPDKGIYDAMNKGLVLAKGDLVCFMNAGDEFERADTLSTLVASIADARACHLSRAHVEGEHAAFINPPFSPPGSAWIGHRIPSHQATFYPRAFAATERYDTAFGSAADSDYTFRCMTARGYEFHDQVTARFRLGGTSNQFAQWRRTQRSVRERRRIVFAHRHWFAPNFALVYITGPILAYLAERVAGPRFLGRLRSWKGKGTNAARAGD